jgi:hypothetical protein
MTATDILYDWPRAAAFGRVIPKNKIYEHAGANSALKDLFVRDVEQVIWAYKLAPETVNLAATERVAEVQVLRIIARTKDLDPRILRAIDKAIPFPVIFEIVHDGRSKLAAAYKRPSEAGTPNWVVGEYFEGEWLPEDGPRTPLPVALDMGVLYEQLLAPLVAGQTSTLLATAGISSDAAEPLAASAVKSSMPLEARLQQAEMIRKQLREIERITAKLWREKQFNKRVAINAELRAARKELARLTSTGNNESVSASSMNG